MGVTVVDKTVCVTGTVPGLSRPQANAKLQQAGAHTVGTVTRNTHLLICGAGVGPAKVAKAEKIGVTVIGWEDVAWDGNGDEAPVHEKAPAPRSLSFVQVSPMLAVKGELDDIEDDEWAYEIKWDGNRAVAHYANGAVAIQSRSAKTDYTKRFPHIAQAIVEWGDARPGMESAIIDGEIMVIDGNEGGSFQALANHANSGSAVFVIFDVLEVNGKNVRQQPFTARRSLLEDMIPDGPLLTVSPLWENGAELLEFAREKGLEGIMAKPLGSIYREGHRGPWVKLKVRLAQEFAVLGYTPAEGQFAGGVGALLLGYYDPMAGGWKYCGKAGTGFTKDLRYELVETFAPIAGTQFEEDVAMTDKERRELARENAVWIEPFYVAQTEFQRVTNDGRLWHPAFKGFRDDKEATEVTEAPPTTEVPA